MLMKPPLIINENGEKILQNFRVKVSQRDSTIFDFVIRSILKKIGFCFGIKNSASLVRTRKTEKEVAPFQPTYEIL